MYDATNKIRDEQRQEGLKRRVIKGWNNNDSVSVIKKEKKPFAAKGHDRILERLQQAGESISVYLLSNDREILKGKIVARDRYTIVIENENSKSLVFKSAISFISFDDAH